MVSILSIYHLYLSCHHTYNYNYIHIITCCHRWCVTIFVAWVITVCLFDILILAELCVFMSEEFIWKRTSAVDLHAKHVLIYSYLYHRTLDGLLSQIVTTKFMGIKHHAHRIRGFETQMSLSRLRKQAWSSVETGVVYEAIASWWRFYCFF